MYLKPASSIQHFLKTKWCYSLSIRFLSYGNDNDFTLSVIKIKMVVTIKMKHDYNNNTEDDINDNNNRKNNEYLCITDQT